MTENLGGVTVDNRLDFKLLIAYTSKKTSKLQVALPVFLSNIGPPRYERILLLYQENALNIQVTRRTSIDRLSALRSID